MSTPLLKTLKLVAASRPDAMVSNPKERARAKLVLHLLEQKAMATAELEGREFQPTRMVSRKTETGERVREEKARRVRCDWFEKDGSIFFQVRYGAKPIEISKGMLSIEVGKLEALPGVIDTLVKAVEAGELDTPLMTAAQERSKNFRRKAQA